MSPPASRPSDGAEHEVRQVEQSSRAIANTLVQALDAAHATTSPTQVRALLAIEESGGCSNAELVATLNIFPSSASRLTDRLIAAGLVARQPGRVDRREINLTVTAAGRRSVQRFVRARMDILSQVMASMTRSDRAALGRGLAAFTAAAQQPRSPR